MSTDPTLKKFFVSIVFFGRALILGLPTLEQDRAEKNNLFKLSGMLDADAIHHCNFGYMGIV